MKSTALGYLAPGSGVSMKSTALGYLAPGSGVSMKSTCPGVSGSRFRCFSGCVHWCVVFSIFIDHRTTRARLAIAVSNTAPMGYLAPGSGVSMKSTALGYLAPGSGVIDP